MLFEHFDWNMTHQVLFLYILHSREVSAANLEALYFGAELRVVAASFL